MDKPVQDHDQGRLKAQQHRACLPGLYVWLVVGEAVVLTCVAGR